MEEENWDDASSTVTNKSNGYSNWDLTKANNTKSNGSVNTNFSDWDLTKNKTNHNSNNYKNYDEYKEEDITLMNGQFYGDSTNTGYNKLSKPTYVKNYQQTKNMYANSEPVNDSWGNPISPNGIHSIRAANFNSYSNDNTATEDSWGNEIASNSYQNNKNKGYQGSNYGHRQGRGSNNYSAGTSSGNTNNINEELESEKPTVSKPTYIPPEFEVDDNLTIEAGSNFEKYDKIEVTVSGMEVPKNISSFQESGLSDVLINNLIKCHYTTPTPIQKYALPIIMDGRDMIASAQTGSGKTVSVKNLPIIYFLTRYFY